MTSLTHALSTLASHPRAVAAATVAREACTELRWHEALRRRIPEACAESRIRGARASAMLDGARLPLERVREMVLGLGQGGDLDPVERVVMGAVAATSESERLRAVVRRAPYQGLARLHVAATAGLLPADQVGRPRAEGEACAEVVDLGAAPGVDVVAERLAALADIVAAVSQGLPALAVAAIVHAEVMTVRPFVAGNGLVARAMERAIVAAFGLDPTGVAVPETGHERAGLAGYLGALTAYGSGGLDGVLIWLE
ncbi:MAG TPA: hypothetical protein VHM65_03050, partial [Candidatus Lustribacter sp.]|nr:hypothetical protein [Candidatus Lustribacter sp.]